MDEIKHKIEALLFSSGKKMSVSQLCALTREDTSIIVEKLKELQQDYEVKQGSLMVVDEGDEWKITVRERHLTLVKRIVSQTELSKTVMETLATIAWKAPCLQSEIIKIRTNKAYDHIKELEQSGYLTKTKQGRTMLIKLAQKFYDYFDIPQDKVKQVFSKYPELEKDIEAKEQEAEKVKDEIKKIEAEHKRQREAIQKMEQEGIEVDEPEKETKTEIVKEAIMNVEQQSLPKDEHLGKLDVVDMPDKETVSDLEAQERFERPLPEEIKERVENRADEIYEGEAQDKQYKELDTKDRDEDSEESDNIADDQQDNVEDKDEDTDMTAEAEKPKGQEPESPESRADKKVKDRIDKRAKQIITGNEDSGDSDDKDDNESDNNSGEKSSEEE